MSTDVRVWEIRNGALKPVVTSMEEAGKSEVEHLERWLRTDPTLLGDGIVIIGEQVQTRSGPLDFLGIDAEGNTVIVELKRGRLPREALAQALDYASDVATWDVERLEAECEKGNGKTLAAAMSEAFEEAHLEELSVNEAQRVILVGTSVDEALQRMIEWLSDGFGVPINAAIFKYIQTSSHDELIASTMIIPEEVARERTQRRARRMPPSNEPGKYELQDLEEHLRKYLSRRQEVPRRIRDILLPLCLEHGEVTRDMLKQELIAKDGLPDEGTAGIIISTIAGGITFQPHDYIRQVIRYDPGYPMDNFGVPEEYSDLVRSLLAELRETDDQGAT